MISRVYSFLTRVDNDFNKSISSKVNLLEYAEKLVGKANIFTAIKNKDIIGLVAIYCNDPTHEIAYIPFLAVDKGFRGQHISRSLMKSAITYASSNGFRKIGVHTENPVALNLYLSLGFNLKENGEQKYLELSLN